MPQGRLKPSAVGVEKLEFILSDNGTIIIEAAFSVYVYDNRYVSVSTLEYIYATYLACG